MSRSGEAVERPRRAVPRTPSALNSGRPAFKAPGRRHTSVDDADWASAAADSMSAERGRKLVLGQAPTEWNGGEGVRLYSRIDQKGFSNDANTFTVDE